LATTRSSKKIPKNEAMPRPAEVCNCTCNCSGKVFTADVEGIKLDMTTILESRLDTVSLYNTVISDLKSLKDKQQILEAIIRMQEETICNLMMITCFLKRKIYICCDKNHIY
jgi:hypothetical protein